MGTAALLIATLRHARSRGLDRSQVGLTVEGPIGPVGLAEARVFAAATGDDVPVEDREGAPVPPLLVARYVHPLLMRLVTRPELKLNLLRMVHAEQAIAWERPLRLGDRALARLTLAEVRDTAAGELAVLRFAALVEGVEVGGAEVGLMIRARGRAPGRSRSPSRTAWTRCTGGSSG